MGAILSKLWPNRSNNPSNNNNNQPPLAITAPPVRLPLPSPPISENDPASENKDATQHQGKKASKKQQSGQQSNKSAVKNEHPLPNQSFIYKTVLETTVSDANAIEEEERKKAEEAPGPFEIETDLLSPEVEEAVIKIQANVRGYLTRKQYRATPERSIEKPSSQVNQEHTESSNDASSSGILAPPPSFSDTPKELPLDEDNQTVNQGKQIAEKLIELEKQVSQAVKPYDKKPAEDIETNSRRLSDQKANSSNDDITVKSSESNDSGENSNNPKLLEIPSIETDLSEPSAPGEAATKIQAAFRGYQVRKTISREASPLKYKDKTDDKGSEFDEFADKEGKVNLRERVSTSAQDSERESILVLDQLEEALSKELLKTSGKTEDETSSSSNSTDIDLNSSMKSNSSLIQSTQVDNDAVQKVTTESPSQSSDIEDKEPQDSLINSNSPQSDDKSLTNNLKNDNLSSTNIESVVCAQSSKLMQVNDPVPNTVASDLKGSEILDPSSNGNIVETISNEPVVFVSNEDKVDASPKLESEEAKQETDAVVMVEVAGKLNASPLPELTSDSKINLSENIHVKSDILHEVQSDSNEDNQPKNELKLDSLISMETGEVLNQFVTKSEETTDSEVDQIPTCDKPNILSKKETDSLPQLIASNVPQSVQENTKILELSSPQSPEPPTTSPSSIPDDPSNAIVKEKSSETMESILAKETNDIKVEGNVALENKDLQDELQKPQKLLKEDSFGSDILILDDDSIDRSDTLYDIIAEKGLNVSESSNQQHAPIFDNDIKEEKGKDLLLNLSVDPIVFSLNTDASESITEMKDDILVNLDESDEDENKNIEKTINTKSTVGNDNQISTISKANNENDQLSNEKSNTSISNESVSSHVLIEDYSSLTSANSANDQISTSVKPRETSSETHVQLSENFKEPSDKDHSREQLENNDIATNETIIKPINESLDEQMGSNMESYIKEPSSSSDDQLEKSDKISAIVPDEHSKDHVSQEIVRSQEVSSVDQINPDTDLLPKMKPLEIKAKTSRDLSIESNENLEAESTAGKSSPPKVDIKNESEVCLNKTEFIDPKSISQTPIKINVQTTLTTAEAVQEKPDENSNTVKDDQGNLIITKGKSNSIDSLESQPQSRTVQDDLTTLKQTKESESNLHSEPSTGLNLDESSCSSQSVVIINQPEIVESSVASELQTSSTESTPNEESDDKTEDSNPEDENRLLRIVDRETRSKSPNPFGRKRRKGKKGRAVQ